MRIKTFKDLELFRKKCEKETGARAGLPLEGCLAEITVGMATCGIAAGADKILEIIKDEIKKQNLEGVRVVKVGCIGFCHYEPIVQVNMPDSKPVYYGNVNEDTAREIVRKHIASNEYVDDSIINLSFDKA